MPKLPRDVSGERAVKALIRGGWKWVSQRGSHMKLAKGTETLSIPAHPNLKPGTLNAILKRAGLSVEAFLDLL